MWVLDGRNNNGWPPVGSVTVHEQHCPVADKQTGLGPSSSVQTERAGMGRVAWAAGVAKDIMGEEDDGKTKEAELQNVCLPIRIEIKHVAFSTICQLFDLFD